MSSLVSMSANPARLCGLTVRLASFLPIGQPASGNPIRSSKLRYRGSDRKGSILGSALIHVSSDDRSLMVLSAATAVLFGLLPAIQSTKTDLVPALKNEAGGARFRYWHLRDYMVAAQVSISNSDPPLNEAG